MKRVLLVLLGDRLFAALHEAPRGPELVPMASGQLARLLFDLALVVVAALALPMPRVTVVLGTLVVALLMLHVDTWNADVTTLVLGWLPWDLAYHLLWMAGATAAVLYMTSSAIWPEDQDGAP